MTIEDPKNSQENPENFREIIRVLDKMHDELSLAFANLSYEMRDELTPMAEELLKKKHALRDKLRQLIGS